MDCGPNTIRFWRGRLPHWEVVGGRYFITVRVNGSLPRSAFDRVRSVHRSLMAVEAKSAAFERLQRNYFLLVEYWIHRNGGWAPFSSEENRRTVRDCLIETGERLGWSFPHLVVMPNHVHFIAIPDEPEPKVGMAEFMRQCKGRVAYELSSTRTGNHPFWQREWFDRWMRSEAEERRTIDYIRMNPVKAGLAATDALDGYVWLESDSE